jgi:galactokinase
MSLDLLFKHHFHDAPAGIAVAPGRVNLIGEHTDYNDGFVLPMNVDRHTRLAFRPRRDAHLRVFSEHAGQTVELPLGDVATALPPWARYVAQVAAVLKEAGLPIGGFDAAISSDVPVGGGLSSSASLEAAVAAALLASADVAHAGQTLDDLLSAVGKNRKDLALLCQEAEHRVGVMCGIMDQFVVLHGTRDHALLLDCRTLETRPVELDGRLDLAVVIINSRVHHNLAANAYNERRRQCEEAVRVFAECRKGVTALRDVEMADWEKWSGKMDEVVARRARHVIGENARALLFAAALERGDLGAAGSFMNTSHASLRDDYEVSCRELDLLVEIAQAVPGVYGSRMTGGGFGGCTVTLCTRAAVEPLRAAATTRYRAATGQEPDVLVTRAAGCAELAWA